MLSRVNGGRSAGASSKVAVVRLYCPPVVLIACFLAVKNLGMAFRVASLLTPAYVLVLLYWS